MNQRNISKLITEALAIEAEEAKQAGAVGFMARALTQATMPHKATPGNEFTRRNGLFTLRIKPVKKIFMKDALSNDVLLEFKSP